MFKGQKHLANELMLILGETNMKVKAGVFSM